MPIAPSGALILTDIGCGTLPLAPRPDTHNTATSAKLHVALSRPKNYLRAAPVDLSQRVHPLSRRSLPPTISNDRQTAVLLATWIAISYPITALLTTAGGQRLGTAHTWLVRVFLTAVGVKLQLLRPPYTLSTWLLLNAGAKRFAFMSC
jgi:hypothetical protein